jgi:hypothetical protein
MSWNRNAETQRRLKRRYQPRYRNPIYFDEDKNRWIHYEFREPKYRAFCKKLANRRARHSNEYFQAKGKYKRTFNFWNELI